jgi:hypothetical protein
MDVLGRTPLRGRATIISYFDYCGMISNGQRRISAFGWTASTSVSQGCFRDQTDQIEVDQIDQAEAEDSHRAEAASAA